MKSLPNITLISYDNSANPEKTLRALQHCARLFQFAAVVLVCSRQPKGAFTEKLHVVPEKGYAAAMRWEVAGLPSYVHTDYALCIHHDGYIINPDKWTDDWLQYDFIGAPWPKEPSAKHPGKAAYPNARVGNTGFCLKSQAFMQHAKAMSGLFLARQRDEGQRINSMGLGGDMFCCQYQRPELEALGIKFAPVEVAADFSWEDTIEEFPNGRPDAFGFHNFNLAPGKNVPRV